MQCFIRTSHQTPSRRHLRELVEAQEARDLQGDFTIDGPDLVSILVTGTRHMGLLSNLGRDPAEKEKKRTYDG